jgi:peptide/nickel transport system permease protein
MPTLPDPSASVPGSRYWLVAFVARRLGLAVVTLLVVSIGVFAGTATSGASAAVARLGTTATPAARAALNHTLGLDRPLPVRYWSWLSQAVRGDLGHSYVSGNGVTGLIAHQGGNTLVLSLLAAVLLVPCAIGFGVLAGLRAGGPTDRTVLASAALLTASPQFVVGMVLALVFAVWLRWLPAVSTFPDGPFGHPLILILPVLALVTVSLGQVTRLVRAGVAQVAGGDAVESARLNGIGEGRVVWRWILPGGVRPALPAFATTLAYLFAGTLVVETTFGYPGLASVLVQAVDDGDVPVVQGVALVAAAVTVGLNLVADLIGLALDPLLRLSPTIPPRGRDIGARGRDMRATTRTTT